MKYTVLFLLSWQIVSIYSQDTIPKNEIMYNNSKQLFYKYKSDIPYTGYGYEKLDSYSYYQYFESGKIKFVDFYYDSGAKWKKIYLGSHGEEQGNYIEYYEDGKRYAKGKYLNGMKNGTWKYWNRLGKLCLQEKYNVAGNLINSKDFDGGCK